MKRGMTLLTIAAAAQMLSACGNFVQPSSKGSRIASYGSVDYDPYLQEYDGECPQDPNILPIQDLLHDGSGRYRACYTSVSNEEVRVIGHAPPGQHGSKICAFPAQQSGNSIYWKPDTTSGYPLFVCKSPNDVDGVVFKFTGMTVNYLYVVREQDANQMQRCLALGNPYECPQQYSRGRFGQ